MRTQRFLAILAWAFLTFIAFATLLPYSWRPELTETEPTLVVMVERAGAFCLLGLLLLVSYPKRLRTICSLVFVSAVALELCQAVLPDRHARFSDILEKIVGGGGGILLGVALLPVLMGSNGLLCRIDRQWFGRSSGMVDNDIYELVIGFFAIALLSLTLVLLQTVGS